MKKHILITITFLLFVIVAYTQGTITNISVEQGTMYDLRKVDIQYDLSGSDAAYDITLEVSFDNGSTYVAIDNDNVTGELLVASGTGKQLTWDGSVNFSAQNSNFARIKITATTHTLAIGEYFQGGVVFYLDGNGGGLICAITDQNGGSTIQWYNGSFTTTGATGTAIGTGQANTTAIINNQGAGSYAATVCTDLGEGWFLPSKDELNEMYQNKAAIDAAAIANGGTAFAVDTYWSSSESHSLTALVQYYFNGFQFNLSKELPSRVRAVRAF